MNPFNGILSYCSRCFRCKNIILHDLELDQNLYDDIEIAFYRLVDTMHLLCQSCGLGILNNEFFGSECILCHVIFCVCDGDEFKFYRINLSSVLMRTQEVIEMELRMWDNYLSLIVVTW